jgi:hypothetical protein
MQRYKELKKRHSAHAELLSLIKTLLEQDATKLFSRVRAGGDIKTSVKNV